MVNQVKLYLVSFLIAIVVSSHLSAAKINGVFFERDCNWYATEENGTQSLLALLYLSEEDRFGGAVPFFITFIINSNLDGKYEGWDNKFVLIIDGKKHTVAGSVETRQGIHQLVLSPDYFDRINAAMKAGNTVQVVGLKNVKDQYFSLKGYTKTVSSITAACNNG